MALPHVPYAAQTAPTMSELDDTFAALGALSIIPCTAAGLSAITLTPKTTPSTPTVSAYADNQVFSFVAAAGNLGPVTVNVNGLGALPLYFANGNQITASGSTKAGALYVIAYALSLNSGAGGFQLLSSNGPVKLIQRIVTTTSALITSAQSVVAQASGVTASSGVQALITTLTPVASTNQILARASLTAAASSTGNFQLYICQGSTVISGALVFNTSDNPATATTEAVFAMANTSTISFQTRVSAIGGGGTRISVNGNQTNGMLGGGQLVSTMILEEWTTGT